MSLKIKFFIGDYNGPLDANWCTEAVALAQGFTSLGVPFYANIDYWKDPKDGKLLFTKAPAGFEADVNIYYGQIFFDNNKANFSQIAKTGLNILLERNDVLVPYWQHPDYSPLWDFDLILISHYNHNQTYPAKNVKPWQIGFDQRMIDYIAQYDVGQQALKPAILDTFRLHHNIRNLSVGSFKELLKDKYPTERQITEELTGDSVALTGIDLAYWNMTGRRHNPEYYKIINQYLLNYCFGGFYHPKPSDQTFVARLIRQLYKVRIKTRPLYDPNAPDNFYIYQWDSFRLWETWLSNSCPIFLDLEHWGFELPVMPTNWEHYIGVKGFDFPEAAERLQQMSAEEIQNIASAGKQWAMDNYSPAAIAQRFLGLMDGLKK